MSDSHKTAKAVTSPRSDLLRGEFVSTIARSDLTPIDYWADLLSPVVEIERTSRPDFKACARAYDLGRLHHVSLSTSALQYQRSASLIQGSDIDHWVLTLRRSGTEVTRYDGSQLESTAGTLDIRSLAAPFSASTSRSRSIMLFLSRDNFASLASCLDAANNRPLTGSMQGIIREFLFSLDERMESATLEDVPVIVNSVTTLLRAALELSRETLEEAAAPIATSLLERARRYIHANLRSADLGPGEVCKAIGISRRQLYYVFEKLGGVATYIRRRRLIACHDAIVDAADHRLISTIAYDYGFTNAPQFSRNFLSEFGYSPTEARDFRHYGYRPLQQRPATLREWLMQFRD
ncbi:helix-turn-helix domain-containing protein [Ciceribacter sp. L1K23]|uniref:helix-turn-helix domain-containing protein n=1 Tax=Ciceribacter sp. L1K23 TaxID=2820276 RepID=UPI001B8425CA|nr:helix-turn-helix domain-containing protein [Ciceribacter sp. L1K23]MBR0554524.1 helix-turn-helix domain-containing protein [Ciceribacter sp. L1K23]